MSYFKSRVSCTFSSCIFQSKNLISWFLLFFVSALQFEGSLIPMCGIQCLSSRWHVSLPCVPWKRKFLSSLKWPWCFSSTAWCAETGKTWNFTSYLFVPSFCVKFNRLSSFLQSWGLRCSSLSILLWWKDSLSSRFLLPFETCEQWTFFSENVAVNLYPVNVVDRAFEYSVATTFVLAIACGSDSHCVTWFIAYLSSVFCSFSSRS